MHLSYHNSEFWIYYLDQKVSGIFQKIKNSNLFNKIDIVPFKVLLIDCNALNASAWSNRRNIFYTRFSVWLAEPFSIFTILKMKSSLHQRVCIKFWVKNGFDGAKILKKCYSIENKLLCVAQVFVSLSRMTNTVDIENPRKRR